MRVLSFLFLPVVAACTAVPQTSNAPAEPVAAARIEAVPPLPPSAPPPPVPPPPPNSASFLVGAEPVLQSTGDPRVDDFRDRVFSEGGPGWRPFLLRAFAGMKANPAILAAVAERPTTAADYVRKYVTPERIAAGRRLHAELQRRPLTSLPGRAPLEVRVALWGVLADYGESPPPFDMIQTLLMLGAYRKGPAFTQFNIYEAVQILAEDRVPRADAKAYADGRIGQARWFTEEYLRFARDGNGDGRIDVWTSRADIFANMDTSFWEEDGMPLIVEVLRPRIDMNDPGQRRFAETLKRNPNLQAAYFTRADGQPWPNSGRAWGGEYIEPFGANGPFYLLSSRNFAPVNYRNPFLARYESAEEHPGFGIAVGLLADAIAGRRGPTRTIPR